MADGGSDSKQVPGTIRPVVPAAFYRRCGYDEEARIRDFYAAGEDQVVFRKALRQPDGLQRAVA